MSYELVFVKSTQKEWDKLSADLKLKFKKKLVESLQNPHVQKDRSHGMPNCYKIKLRPEGYRLIYQVIDKKLIIEIISVGKRERLEVYHNALF
jgi:mRNA interferase RelE/StbE